jgi:uncharacterized damage-inducible protein DinB
MNRKIALASIVPALWLISLSAPAQDSSKKDVTIKPAPSPSQAVLDSWNDIGRKLTAMAEDFPEDKYDFKPNPAQRSFAEQLLHAAGANYYFTNVVRGEKAPPEDYPKRDQFKSKSDVVGFVKKSFADGAAVIKEKGDSGMTQVVTDNDNHYQARVADLAYGLIEHDGEHYGQLVGYYRASGLVPPESRPKK